MNKKEIQENLELAQTILSQWIRFRQYYHKGISDQEIAPDDEAEFLETKSAIAQNVRKLGQKLDGKKFNFRQNEISNLLKTMVSMHGFRNMPEPDRKTFYKDWHASLMYLSRTVGAFKFLSEGYVPPGLVAKGKKGKKGGSKNTVKIVVGIVVALAVVVGIGMFLGLIG